MNEMTPEPPPSLGERGAAFWRTIMSDYELEQPDEAERLLETCRQLDLLESLQAVIDREGVLAESSQGIRCHPAVTELRQARLAAARLLAALGSTRVSRPALRVASIRCRAGSCEASAAASQRRPVR